MNTIPTTFNKQQFQRTIVGGSELSPYRDENLPISVLLLNRGGKHYRSQVFDQLKGFGFQSIMSVESAVNNYDIEQMSRNYPYIKFLIPQEEVTIGDIINMGMAELETEYVFVLWSDVHMGGQSVSARLIEKIILEKRLCLAPLLLNERMTSFPIAMVPLVEKSSLRILPGICYKDNSPTLYPFDNMGIYNREKFIQLGGFDYTIRDDYWQNVDFFFRSWLWNEEVRISTIFRLNYEGEIPQEDITPNEPYLRFYLKNIAPQFKGEYAQIPFNKLFPFLKRSPRGFFESIGYFKAVRAWVEKNKTRFSMDAKLLIDTWGREEK